MDSFTKKLQSIIILFLSGVCVLGIFNIQKPFLDEDEDVVAVEEYQQQEKIESAQLKLFQNLPSFGFDNLISSWLFLSFIQYYGDGEARNVMGYRLLPDYYRSVVDRDPRFAEAYFILDPAVTLFSARPDVSILLLTKGTNYVRPSQPRAYQIWLFKANNELLFLGDNKSARKSFEMAAQWAKAENTENSLFFHRIFLQTANFLAKNPDSKKARASSWLMILDRARDNKTKQIVLRELEKLGAQITVEGDSISVEMPKYD